jgi:dipeptidase
MASDNIYDVAKENGWWDGNKETFMFNHVYAPESRNSVASRRREWRVFDLAAPSLNLDPNAQDYPFSVKPDEKITLEKMVEIFSDYYQGTPYDMRRNITTTDKDGKTIISPLANPFMPYDQLELHNVSGGWYHVDKESGDSRFLGERTIARWYTMYGTITQSRSWLPNEIGGKVWLAQDNIANSIYIPVYSNITHLPKSYSTPGRPNGYTMESAWWAFNRLGTLAAQRWGDMHKDIDAVWDPMQAQLFEEIEEFEKKALELHKAGKTDELVELLTEYTNKWGDTVVKRAWKLGDELWTKYDELF